MPSRVALLGVPTSAGAFAPGQELAPRNEGLALDIATRALAVLVASERLSALTVTELNPLHGDEDGRTLGRFVDSVVGCLRAVPAPR